MFGRLPGINFCLFKNFSSARARVFGARAGASLARGGARLILGRGSGRGKVE
jgi:hypothetical protein